MALKPRSARERDAQRYADVVYVLLMMTRFYASRATDADYFTDVAEI